MLLLAVGQQSLRLSNITVGSDCVWGIAWASECVSAPGCSQGSQRYFPHICTPSPKLATKQVPRECFVNGPDTIISKWIIMRCFRAGTMSLSLSEPVSETGNECLLNEWMNDYSPLSLAHQWKQKTHDPCTPPRASQGSDKVSWSADSMLLCLPWKAKGGMWLYRMTNFLGLSYFHHRKFCVLGTPPVPGKRGQLVTW